MEKDISILTYMEKRRFYHLFSDGFRTDSCRRSEPIDFDIKLMEDEKYILNSIAYVLRNGIAAGIGAKYQYLGIAGAG